MTSKRIVVNVNQKLMTNKNESRDTLENCNIHNTSFESDANMMQHEIHQNNIADESCSANDNELLEDQAALDRRQNMIDDPLPSVVEFDNIENCIFNCAPGENLPKYVLLDDDFELLAFPDLFPYGCGGYNYTDRSVKLPIRKYFKQCLLNVNGQFAENRVHFLCSTYSRSETHTK